ncbi:DNA polymerase III, delta subunit [Melghirimyces thermohalophilus]|uniref:DNA polymerase III subunit delta n=1 Tax=Melghirimyces thermohalophilus TaxID=1236220 RepID=A0A1G6P200_9BACL|nr:DNA polymerase III subunit delta [Melghirimyces thermohalophilus]SDC73634.1 DNA polymerase III, delta subunit [Melghirimyces thermohalophilus]
MERTLLQEIRAGQIAPVYLFYGTETFLMEEALNHLEEQVLTSAENRDWNHTVLDLEEVPVQALVQEAETPSFFGDRRLVVGKNAWFLTAARGREKQKLEHRPEELLQYAKQPLESNVLVIMVPAEKLDARKKVVKELKKQVREGVFQPLDSRGLHRWVADRLKQTGADIHPDTADILIRQVGADLRLLDMEARKLALYASSSGTIRPETVTELVPRTLEQDVFKLVDRVARRKNGEAMAVFRDLLENREEPIRILALLIRQFRIMLQVKGLAAKGMSEREIASQLKLHPYPVKLALQQGKSYPEKNLRRLLYQAIETDQAIKSGRLEKTLAVERFILTVE